jgi:hypothetical protein
MHPSQALAEREALRLEPFLAPWHARGMRLLLLVSSLGLVALSCVANDAPPSEFEGLASMSAAVGAVQPESVLAPAERGWVAEEMRGADFARQYTDTLELVVPRELAGPEADGRARRAFLALTPTEQLDLLDWFTVECEKLRSLQNTLIRYVLDAEGAPPRESWPALAPAPIYEPTLHAPGQPIPRRPLAAEAPDAIAVRNQLLSAPGVRRLDSGWMVDYAARGLVRLPHAAEPVRVFENALLGMAPDWDRAEAMVELALDGGALQTEFTVFAHAYTDRWGGVYPGVTLYDACASLQTIEMPDVDTLGIVHDLFGDWTTYTSPVPAEQHEELYGRTSAVSNRLIRYRGLRTNLARTYLCGTTELRDGYAHNLDNFHALWESVSSTPAALAAQLPDDAGWRDYLQAWADRCVTEPELLLKGTQRHAQLEREQLAVRATMLRLLGEYGAYAKLETLPPFDE